MANENWRPGSGRPIPTNIPIKVDPKFKTIGLPGSQDGWIPLDPNCTNQNCPFHRIDEIGAITFKSGPNAPTILDLMQSVTKTIQDFTLNTTSIQSLLQKQLETRAPQLGVSPSPTQPTPPTAPAGEQSSNNTGSTDGGPNSELQGARDAKAFDLKYFKDLSDEFADRGEKEKYKKWSLKYPSTIESGQDRILISQYQYVSGLTVSENSNSVIKGESRFVNKDFIGQVVLPMPNDLSESNSVGWGEDSLGNFAAMAMPGLAKLGVGLSEFDLGKSGAGLSQLKGLLESGALGKRVEQYLVTNAAAALLKKINVNINPEAYITRATGAAVNPNLELLFNGPKLRQFGLAFKMTPRSESEAQSIRAIIQFFKKGMAPRRSSKNELNFFLGTPNVFKVKFMGSGNNELKSIGKFKTCALVSFNANYTADGFYAAYQDSLVESQPIAVTMQMGFTELTPVFSDEYDLDDAAVNIGPTKFENDTYELKATDTPSPGAPGAQGAQGTQGQQGGERRGSEPQGQTGGAGETNTDYRNPTSGERSSIPR